MLSHRSGKDFIDLMPIFYFVLGIYNDFIYRVIWLKDTFFCQLERGLCENVYCLGLNVCFKFFGDVLYILGLCFNGFLSEFFEPLDGTFLCVDNLVAVDNAGGEKV